MRYRKWHHVIVCALCAPLLATAATYWTHYQVYRYEIPWPPVFEDMGCPICTCYLKATLGISDDESGLEVPRSYRDQYPDWDRFLDGLEQQIAQRVPKDAELFDAWIAPLGRYKHAPHGWPFISQERAFVVEIDWRFAGKGHFEQFYLAPDGLPPERPEGMMRNWLFYLILAIPFVWFLPDLIRLIWRHLRRFLRQPSSGFPVIILDEPANPGQDETTPRPNEH